MSDMRHATGRPEAPMRISISLLDGKGSSLLDRDIVEITQRGDLARAIGIMIGRHRSDRGTSDIFPLTIKVDREG